jgi:hypothetical protein
MAVCVWGLRLQTDPVVDRFASVLNAIVDRGFPQRSLIGVCSASIYSPSKRVTTVVNRVSMMTKGYSRNFIQIKSLYQA